MVYPSKDFLFLFFFVPPLSSSLCLWGTPCQWEALMVDDTLIPQDRIYLLGDSHRNTRTHTAFEEEATYASSAYTAHRNFKMQARVRTHTRTSYTCGPYSHRAHHKSLHINPHTLTVLPLRPLWRTVICVVTNTSSAIPHTYRHTYT